MRGMREDVTNERGKSTDRHLSLKRVERPVHLRKQNDGNESANSAAQRRVAYMVQTHSISKVAVCHHGEARQPRPREFFQCRAYKPIRVQIIRRAAIAEKCHR